MIVRVKPLSINEAFQGRRFKTPAYKSYEKECLLKLKSMKVPSGKVQLKITYGFSNSASDIDNPTKLILDILQKKYGWNDKNVYRLIQEKTIVKKGEEFWDFEFTSI